MRSSNRIPNILDSIQTIWSQYPDLRLGQLLGNVMRDYTYLYYVEDEDLIYELKKYYDSISTEE